MLEAERSAWHWVLLHAVSQKQACKAEELQRAILSHACWQREQVRGEGQPGVRQQHPTAEDGGRDVKIVMHLPEEHFARPLAAPEPAREQFCQAY